MAFLPDRGALHLAASRASNTFTISPISQSRDVTPANSAGLNTTTHRKIAGGVSCHSPRRISYVASPFSFLRLDSCREQATKDTPGEELAEKVHWATSSFGRSGYPVPSRSAQLEHRAAFGVSSFSRAPGVAEINCMTCSTFSCTP